MMMILMMMMMMMIGEGYVNEDGNVNSDDNDGDSGDNNDDDIPMYDNDYDDIWWWCEKIDDNDYELGCLIKHVCITKEIIEKLRLNTLIFTKIQTLSTFKSLSIITNKFIVPVTKTVAHQYSQKSICLD